MKKKLTLILILMLIFISSTSCIKEGSNKDKKVDDKEKAPKTLVSVSEGLGEILTSMTDLKKTVELTPQEFEILESKRKNQEEKKDENKKDEKSRIEIKEEELIKKWNDIDKKIGKVHKDWNNYEVEAMKKTTNPEKGKEFKNNLNLCTAAVENRNIENILDTGSKTILSLGSFFDLYKDEMNGDLSRIKHAAYQAYLNAVGGNTKNANNLLDSTGEYITRLRQKLDKDKEKIKRLDKLSLSIADMKQSLNDNSSKLLEIKRDIIISNIKLLEK